MSGVPAHVILTPAQAPYRLSRYQTFKLGDRVVFAAEVGSVSCSSLGTVVGLEPKASADSKKDNGQWIYVVFDEPFLGGGTLGGSCQDKRGLIVGSECLLSISYPQPPLHKRFVPSDVLKSQLIKSEQTASVLSGGKQIYEHKAGKRSLLTALNDRPQGAKPQARSRPQSASQPKPAKKPIPRDKTQASNDELVSQIKTLLNISDAPSTQSAQIPPPSTKTPVGKKTDRYVDKMDKKSWKPIKFVPEVPVGAAPQIPIPSNRLAYTPTSVLQKLTIGPKTSGSLTSVKPNENDAASQHLLSLLKGNSSSDDKIAKPSLTYRPPTSKK